MTARNVDREVERVVIRIADIEAALQEIKQWALQLKEGPDDEPEYEPSTDPRA